MVTPPPPPPPLESELREANPPRKSQRPRELLGRRWPLEAVAAVVLLIVLAAAFHPAAPKPPTAAQRWAAESSRQIVALARDIAGVQGSLATPTGSEISHRPATSSPVLRLRRDLSRVGHLAAPPGDSLKRIWTSALGQAQAAAQILSVSGAAPTATQIAEARADLDTAGQALVAVSAAARTPVRIHPH